jgi:hypothetical protein
MVQQRLTEASRLTCETAKHAHVVLADLTRVVVGEGAVRLGDQLGELVGRGGREQRMQFS